MKKPLRNENGITIRELRIWLNRLPMADIYGEDRVVRVSTGENTSFPIVEIGPINAGEDNSCDLLLKTFFTSSLERKEKSRYTIHKDSYLLGMPGDV
jgi:hypothetical protein